MLRILAISIVALGVGGLWYWWAMGKAVPPQVSSEPSAQTNPAPTAQAVVPANTVSEQKNTKTYRNEEFGFEFEYPANWSLEVNSFNSPFSKLNLIVSLPGDNNVVLHSFLVNIVTADFADNAIVSRKRLNARESEVVIDGVSGVRYEYLFQGLPEIDVDIPLGEYRALIVADKKHEAEFNQILASFKFLRN